MLALLAGCAPVAAPRSLPDELLGRWYATGSSGGLDGGGSGTRASGYVELRPDHVMERFDDGGTLLERVRFEVDRGKTIFSDDEQWILRFDDGSAEVMLLFEGGRSMSLSADAYDAVALEYARAPRDAAPEEGARSRDG